MCRDTMYFKGMYKVQEEWNKESEEKHLENIFNILFEETIHYGMDALWLIQHNFNRIKDILIDFDEEEAMLLVGGYFGPLFKKIDEYHDWGTREQQKRLLVSNYPKLSYRQPVYI